MVNMELEVQIATTYRPLPNKQDFRRWLSAVFTQLHQQSDIELTIRLVDIDESAKLNSTYRHKNGPTNILSFNADLPPTVDLNLLGDLVICAPLVAQEAQQQHKAIMAHWAHLTIHGVLHLLGYDHQEATAAAAMENLEISILQQLAIANPYSVTANDFSLSSAIKT